MFKNKKIVAMVLCALMLFVPVAAMAAPAPVDFLANYYTDASDAKTKAEELTGNTGLVADYSAALVTLAQNPTKANKKAADDALKAYNEGVKDANKAIAKAQNTKFQVERSEVNGVKGYEAFRRDNTGDVVVSSFWCANKTEAKNGYNTAEEYLADAKKAVADAAETVSKLKDVDKIAQEALARALKMIDEANNLKDAEEALDFVADLYDGMGKAYKDIAAPYVQKAWDKYASFADFYTKNAKFNALSEDIQKLLGDINNKYEMMSTGEKGWILADEAKNGCLKDVAEFKVEKKDGKFVAKVYDANGKEIVLKQQLTVYRPIAKDVKVLSAKVDGKAVTFAISERDGQNYVSVPVIY